MVSQARWGRKDAVALYMLDGQAGEAMGYLTTQSYSFLLRNESYSVQWTYSKKKGAVQFKL